MKLLELTVQNIRTHVKKTILLQPTTTLIVGSNGSGKTSLLEAIYISLRGKSFKGTDESIRRYSEAWYRIDVKTDLGVRTVKHRTEGVKKEFEIDTKKHRRLGDATKYPVVLFEPDDLRIVSGSPTRRRDYLDTLLSQYVPQFSAVLHRYERALLQRNKLLKRPQLHKDELFAWNVALSQYGAEIISRRQELVATLQQNCTKTYRTISRTNDAISLHYSYSSPISSQQLLRELEHAYERDRLLGSTSVGPHRHDLEILLNSQRASTTGSRGELRTITLALKFIEADILMQKTATYPIILLDDVFSELDATRQQSLLHEFKNHQVIMTSTTVVTPLKSMPVIALS